MTEYDDSKLGHMSFVTPSVLIGRLLVGLVSDRLAKRIPRPYFLVFATILTFCAALFLAFDSRKTLFFA